MTNEKWWYSAAISMREQGKSSRQIAKDLFGKSTSKSSINDFFKRYDAKNGVNKNVVNNKVNILYFDIENSPSVFYGWGRWGINVGQDQVVRESHLLSVAYAMNDEAPNGVRLTVEDVKNQDDLTAIVDLVEAINKADVLVSFNGIKFDLKVLRTRMLKWGLPPLKPVKHIDLYQQAKNNFRFPSNSMDNICKYLGYSILKQDTGGFKLWRDCMNTEDYEVSNNALVKLLEYNKGDIEVTRNLYKQMQGWTSGVNISVITNAKEDVETTIRCTKCGSDDVEAIDSTIQVGQSVFNLYRCGSCRGVSRINSTGKTLLDVV